MKTEYTTKAQVGNVIELEDGQYVVTRTAMQGGGSGHGPHDVFPDGWNVKAQKLSENQVYDPNGEKIDFYQSGCFTGMKKKVKVVGQMIPTFINDGDTVIPTSLPTYRVTTEGDIEGRSTRQLGFAIGNPDQIKAYFDSEKEYRISVTESSLPKIVHVTQSLLNNEKDLKEKRVALEKKMDELKEEYQSLGGLEKTLA